MGCPNASRAVGRAVGSNPVSWIIPCHRVLRKQGELGGYRWGTYRKQVLLARERSAQQLELSPAQQAEWEALQADAIELRRQLLEDVADNLPELEQALAAPDADLGLLAQHVQSQVLYALWQTQPIRERRLAFYESLNPEQQALVRDWLIAVVQRLERVVSAVQLLQAD